MAIENHAEYIARHQHEMDSIKSQLHVCKDKKESWSIYKKLHLSYTTFSIDSADHYATKMEEIALSSGDKELEFQSKLARITVLHAQFEYREGRKYKAVPQLDAYKKKVADGAMTVTDACTQLGISRSKWYKEVSCRA